MPRKRVPISEFISGSADRSLLTCPGCGRENAFYVTNTWRASGAKRRLRKCRFCGYAANETVPEPIRDGENE
jgi:hypothetical protein